MKVHSILIVVENPGALKPIPTHRWHEFLNQARRVSETNAGIETIAENTFLISLENGMCPANQILNSAEQNDLKYRLLFFEEKPEWILSKPAV
ncbi:MAG TPA: hypothetical protein VK737_00440 [Opitutales bacterium]|jgi:hypothetical protein|nr:hypothetical protein [Opitutales bacterium]